MIASNGNENFLDWGQGSTRYVPSCLAPRPGKFSRSPKLASRGVTPHCSETLVLTHRDLPAVLTTGREA